MWATQRLVAEVETIKIAYEIDSRKLSMSNGFFMPSLVTGSYTCLLHFPRRTGVPMKNNVSIIALLLVSIALVLSLAGCDKVHAQTDGDATTAGASPEPKVVPFP